MMYFRKSDQTLLDADGQTIKQLNCPMDKSSLRMVWESPTRVRCKGCERSLVLAHTQTENELKSLLQEAPETCLLLDLRSPQIEVLEEA